MPRGRLSQGEHPLSDAERQARCRDRRQTQQPTPIVRYRRPNDRRTRPQRWRRGTDFIFYLYSGSPRFSPKTSAARVREGTALLLRPSLHISPAKSAGWAQWLLQIARTLPMLSCLHIDYLRGARYAMLLHQAALIAGGSRQMLDDFLADSVPDTCTRVIYNGIDCARLDKYPGKNRRPMLGVPVRTMLDGRAGAQPAARAPPHAASPCRVTRPHADI